MGWGKVGFISAFMRYNEIYFTKANANMYSHIHYTQTKCEKDGYHNHIFAIGECLYAFRGKKNACLENYLHKYFASTCV